MSTRLALKIKLKNQKIKKLSKNVHSKLLKLSCPRSTQLLKADTFSLELEVVGGLDVVKNTG